jgi:phage regulator Rha-like protein
VTSAKTLTTPTSIEEVITTVRGQRVILAEDLARIYGVQTKVLNQAVKRNIDKFPPDFLFQLNMVEVEGVRCSRSQFVTLKQGKNVKYRPYAFTEHGAIMAANVLNSPQAVQMSVFVVRAFVRMRELLTDTRELARKLADLERELKARLDVHESAIVDILQRVMEILSPPPLPPVPPRRRIGFQGDEDVTGRDHHSREKRLRNR